MSKDKSIFISIASYRDTELNPTIEDCIKKAQYPERLRFSICRQYVKGDKGMNLKKKYRDDPRFTVTDIPCSDSTGVCKIRHDIQSTYDGEDYVLQLDSHHRFVNKWDDLCIDIIKKLKVKSEKPLLTAYLPSYEPEDRKKDINVPWEMRFDRYLPQGPAMPKPETIDDHDLLSGPVNAYFLSGHFIFGEGKFYDQVRYDPELYFHGEEISLTIRAYTHGFDLYHPHVLIAWHHYTRTGSKRHWDDHTSVWDDLNNKSFAKYRKLVKIDKTNQKLKYGLGTERTLKQYIKYSGIDVSGKRIHKSNLDRQRAPMKYEKGEYEKGFCKKIRYCIDLFKGSVPEDDYDVWVTAYKDADGKEIYRKDYSNNEIKTLKSSVDNDDNFYKIWAEFESPTEPVEWLVWPHSKGKDWCDRIVNKIQT